MSRELNRTGPDTTIAEAASLMSQRRVGSALVCRNDRVVGIFTERDLLRAVSHDASAMHDSLEHWMTRRPRTVAPDTDLDEAISLMAKHRAIEDTIQRARHYGAIANDALALFPASPMKEALEEAVEFCITRSN